MDLRGFFEVESRELRLHQAFAVILVIKNETERDQYVLAPNGRADGLRIKLKAGKNVQIKNMFEEPEPGVVAEVKLSAGEIYKQRYPLSEWLIIKEAGSFTVECAAEIETFESSGGSDAATKIPISTELQFMVRPNDGK